MFTGKQLTFPIEQYNSDVRRYLGHLQRKIQVVSKRQTMVGQSQCLSHYLQYPANYAIYAQTFTTLFG